MSEEGVVRDSSVDGSASGKDEPGPRLPLWASFLTGVVFASLPFADFLVANQDEHVATGVVGRWWAATLGITLVVLGAAWVTGRAPRVRRVAVVAAVLLWFGTNFHGFGSVAGWGAALAVAVVVAVFAGRHRVVQTATVVTGTALLVMQLVQLPLSSGGGGQEVVAASTAPTVSLQERPDVWLLVPDGYASPGIVEETTGLDVTPFMDELRSRGFVTPARARANYPVTFLSLPTMLQMDYVAPPGEQVQESAPYLASLRGDNAVVRTFQDNGYRYVQSPPAMWDLHVCGEYADVCIGPSGTRSETAQALLHRTPWSAISESTDARAAVAEHTDPVARVHRLLDVVGGQPTFVFAHLMNPHPPFLRDGSCRLRRDAPLRATMEGAGPDDYRDAVECVNQRLLEAVDAIIRADPDAVVLVQSDHGSELTFDIWSAPSYPDERFGVLSALRIPGCDVDVPDDLSPVNVFRVVFGCLSDRELPLAPDRSLQWTYADRLVRPGEPSASGGDG